MLISHTGVAVSQSALSARYGVRYVGGRILYQVPDNGGPGGAASVSVKLFSLRGALAATVVSAVQAAGTYSVALDNENSRRLAQGTYVAEIKINEVPLNMRIVVK